MLIFIVIAVVAIVLGVVAIAMFRLDNDVDPRPHQP